MSEPALSLLRHLREGNELPSGGRLLVAVSGGADSMALLHLYIRASESLHLTLYAATFDHGLRGGQGASDAEFVMETAQRWGIACAVGYGGLDPGLPAVEARARAARYAFLASAARDFGAGYVATAHHMDDQAETVLLNLIRGTGARGLGGMRDFAPLPDAPDLILVRPLLSVRRADLEAYCRAEGIAWRDDPTNADTRSRRNWARHVALPLLRDANPHIVQALARTASVLADEDSYLDSQTAALLQSAASVTPSRIWIRRAPFESWHTAMQRRVLALAAGQVSREFEPDFGHLGAALGLLSSPEGGETDFSGGIRVVVDSAYITVARKNAAWTPPYDGFWCDSSSVSRLTPVEREPAAEAGSMTITLRAPRNMPFLSRSRRDGDRVFPVGLNGKSQKLKDWFINRKVPRQLRDHLTLIETGGYIAAIWDGGTWQFFAPPFEGETVEVTLSIR